MCSDELCKLRGTIEHIVFRNDDNGYTVLNLSCQGTEIITVGSMPMVGVGEDLEVVGKWKNHHTFGIQFLVESYKRFMPSTCESIVKYLSSGIIKGVGKSTAQRLVDVFGDKTLQVIDKEPEKIFSVKGISKSIAKKISKDFLEIVVLRGILAELDNYGILPEEAIKIYKLLGACAVEQIKINPYILCNEKINISFQKADIISSNLYGDFSSPERTEAGILYIINHNVNNGHTCIPIDKLLPAASKFLNVDIDELNRAVDRLILNDSLFKGKIGENDFVFLPDMYNAEVYCASRLLIMLNYPPQEIKGYYQEISAIEESEGKKYAELQKRAIISAMSQGLLVMTGGPGTGKTTTLNAIIKILKGRGQRVLLAAPTGRAARRLSELTGCESKTIHRMLESGWGSDGKTFFNRNESNMLECDALILDELSMLDVTLFEGLLRALPIGCRLIMVGDTDQLPSVGAGNVLGDLISSEKIPVVQLKEIFRQSRESLIIINSHNIVNGIMPELKIRDSDFFFINMCNEEKIKSTVVDLINRRLPKTYGYSPLYDIQVISPSRKGMLGTISLNSGIQNSLNPSSSEKEEVTINDILLRENDKVIQNKNNYNIYWEKADGTTGEGIFNGEIGVILEIDKSTSSVAVRYEDKVAVYDFETASDLDHAYAVTVHKSQGSEFEAVILPLLGSNTKLYYRNLLYTAVTRTRSLLVIIGSESTIKYMVNNVNRIRRYSALCEFLNKDM